MRKTVIALVVLGLFPTAGFSQSMSPKKSIPASRDAYMLLRRYRDLDGFIVAKSDAQITLRVNWKKPVQPAGQARIHYVDEKVDYLLPLDPKVQIRRLSQKVEFDANGFPLPRSEPGGKADGYPATKADLVVGAEVRVTFLRVYGPVPTRKGAAVPNPRPPAYAPRVGRIVFLTDEFGTPVRPRR